MSDVEKSPEREPVDSPKKDSRSRSPKKSRSRSPRKSRSRSRSRSGRRKDRSRSRSRSARKERSRSRSRGGAPPKDDGFGRKCYIGNLDYRTDKHYLREKFEKFGNIADVFVPQDHTGRPRGFAFVTFEDSKSAEEAVAEMDKADVDGRAVQVNLARERPPLEQSRSSRDRDSDRGRDSYRRRDPPSRKVYVGNLPIDVKESELDDLFYKCGKIVRIDIKHVTRPPGFAFIEFDDERDADDAVRKHNGTKFDKENIRVELAGSRDRR